MRKTTTNLTKSTHAEEQPTEQQQRINTWIERLELQATSLITGTNIDELSAKERVDLAIKVMNQLQRFIALRQQIEVASQPAAATASDGALITDLMRQMRGEGTETE